MPLSKSIKKVFLLEGGTINPAYALLQVEDEINSVTDTVDEEVQRGGSETAKAGAGILNSVIQGGGYIANLFFGYHRFFSGNNQMKSDTRKQAGLLDWLTLGTLYVAEYWAGRAMKNNLGGLAGGLLSLAGFCIKFPLSILRWTFGVALNFTIGFWAIPIVLSIRRAWKKESPQQGPSLETPLLPTEVQQQQQQPQPAGGAKLEAVNYKSDRTQQFRTGPNYSKLPNNPGKFWEIRKVKNSRETNYEARERDVAELGKASKQYSKILYRDYARLSAVTENKNLDPEFRRAEANPARCIREKRSTQAYESHRELVRESGKPEPVDGVSTFAFIP